MVIKGEKVTLTPLTLKHMPKSWEWINDKEITKFLVSKPPKTYKGELKWFENLKKSKTEKIFAITDNATKTHIGNLGLHEISIENSNCVLGIMIGEKNYWNKGFGTAAIKTILKHCFEELNFHKVSLNVFTQNTAAQKCYKKCGFKKVGTLKDHTKKGNQFWDEYIMETINKK